MKLDPTLIRYLDEDDWRVLTAIEMGMKNHELVPTPLIERIAGLRHGGAKKCLRTLARYKLIRRDIRMYEGYTLVYLGYDFLALRTFLRRKNVYSVGNQIGVGKEADIYVVSDEEGREMILKLHRLGRTSFQSVTKNRDYFKGGKRRGAGWLYMSRLAATKEYAFMKALYAEKFLVPVPIDQNRHCVLMSVVPGYVLSNVTVMGHPEKVYKRCLELVTRLAQYGLIHGDLNEYNVMVTDDEQVYCIDFPQMTSTDHLNADMYFERDLMGIHRYFGRKFNVQLEYYPKLRDDKDTKKTYDLDAQVGASGWSKDKDKELEDLVQDVGGWEANRRDKDGNLPEGEEEWDPDAEEEDEDEDEDEDEEGNSLKRKNAWGDQGDASPMEDDEEESAEEEESEEEEPTVTVEEKWTLNDKGRGFFNTERWEANENPQEGPEAQTFVKKSAKQRKAERREQARKELLEKNRKMVSGWKKAETADSEKGPLPEDVDLDAEYDEDAPPAGLRTIDEDHIRSKVKQKLVKQNDKDYVRRACRSNVAKGRQKIKEAQTCKYVVKDSLL